METNEEVIEFLKSQIYNLWLYAEQAVDDRNLGWLKKIIKSIENLESDIRRLK